MPKPQLTPRDRLVLLALMAAATDVSNRELKALCGLELTGEQRRRLNQGKLVASPKIGRALRHELTDEGWDWAKKELSVTYPGGADAGTRVLYLHLNCLDADLSRTDRSASDFFVPPAGPDTELAARIRQAVTDLAQAPGEWVTLPQLRRHLADVPRDDLDTALTDLYQAEDVAVMANANERRLTAADRAEAVRIGGEDRHLIRVVVP